MREDDPSHWQQINIQFNDPQNAEHHSITRLGPALAEAEAAGLIRSWFFIRKQWWRFRYLPAGTASAPEATKLLQDAANAMLDAGHASRWVEGIYEPETHAFGGNQAMTAAHQLFHADSRHILTHLLSTGDDTPGHLKREVSVLLCATMMRAAGQDRYEQGDIWANASDLRPAENTAQPQQWADFTTAIHRLITVDTGPNTDLRTGTLAFASDWLTAFEQAGRTLKALSDEGLLTRGIRAVTAHHLIFHWNRLGLPYRAQANLALAAKEATFGSRER